MVRAPPVPIPFLVAPEVGGNPGAVLAENALPIAWVAGAELGTGGIPTMKGRLFQLWPHAGRWLLGVLLLWAGISKLANPTEFLGAVYSFELPLPRFGLKLLAASLPWAELLLALMLLARYWIQSALWGGLILLAGFTLATGQA